MKVQAGVAAPVSMQEEVYATGNIVPASRQEVNVLTPGRVSKAAVKVGDAVKKGQILVTMDTTLADAQVAQAESNVEAAQTTVDAAQTSLNELKKAQSASADIAAPNIGSPGPAGLSPKVSASGESAGSVNSQLPASAGDQNSGALVNPVSPSAAAQAEGALAQSRAALKQAQEALKVAQVQKDQLINKAVIDGTVLEVNAQEGDLASGQQPLVVVADLSRMNVEARLNEVDAGKVQLDQKVTVTSKVVGKTSIQGSVAQIAPEAAAQPSAQGTASPTVGVKISLAKIPTGLKPGSTVNISIIVANKKGVLAVPLEALFQEGSRNYVYRIQGGSLRKTEVQVGIGDDINQEITSGLKAGDLVVLNPSNQLAEGLEVTPEIGGGVT